MLKELFTPFKLQEKHCLYFYYTMVICIVLLSITLLSTLVVLFKLKKLSACLKCLLNTMPLMISLFLSYFVNRVLYTICLDSTKR